MDFKGRMAGGAWAGFSLDLALLVLTTSNGEHGLFMFFSSFSLILQCTWSKIPYVLASSLALPVQRCRVMGVTCFRKEHLNSGSFTGGEKEEEALGSSSGKVGAGARFRRLFGLARVGGDSVPRAACSGRSGPVAGAEASWMRPRQYRHDPAGDARWLVQPSASEGSVGAEPGLLRLPARRRRALLGGVPSLRPLLQMARDTVCAAGAGLQSGGSLPNYSSGRADRSL